LFSSRVRADLGENEAVGFDDVLRIFPLNDMVDRYNFEHLNALDAPILRITVTGTGRGWEIVASREAGNLDMYVPVAIGSRCMLIENLWVEKGLVNGFFGVVEDLAWREGED
jgi:hypothetical protein